MLETLGIKSIILISFLCILFFDSPWRILDDAGSAFAMGAIGSAIWHGIRGFRNSPRVIDSCLNNAFHFISFYFLIS